MKVSILSRISTSQQSNESGLEELRKICKDSNYEIVEEYVEVVSGSKGKDDRKESFTSILNLLKNLDRVPLLQIFLKNQLEQIWT